MRQTWCGLCMALWAASGCSGTPTTELKRLPEPVNVTTVAIVPGRDTTATATESLGRIGEPAVPALAEALMDSDPTVRVRACRALAFMGVNAKDSVPGLIRLLNDEHEAVREEAARALGQVGPPAAPAVPELIQMMRGPTKQDQP